MKRWQSGFFGKFIVFLLLGMLGVCLSVPVRAEGRVVRVGYYMFDGYQMEDEDQVRSGYGYDFLQELARYTGWQYEYVGYHLGWARLQQMLDAGEIDILTSARKTPARERDYIFSQGIGQSAGILTVKSGSDRVTMGSYATYEGLRVGLIRDSSINENFRRFAARKGFQYVPVEFLNADEMSEALQSGSIDAVCTTNLRRTKNEWIIDQFDLDDFYIMARPDRADLLAEADAGIQQMDFYTPGWRTRLWDTYYRRDFGNQIALTGEEKEYIRQLQEQDVVFTAVVNPDDAPYSYFENGEARGIIPELFAEISRRTGLKFRILPTADRAAYWQAIASRAVDIRMDAYVDYDQAEKAGYQLTMPYISTMISQISLKTLQQKPQRIALLQEADPLPVYHGIMQSAADIQYYASRQECLEAVLSGRADAAYVYPYTAQEYLRGANGDQLAVLTLPQQEASFAIGVSVQQDHRLLSILDKAVASVNANYTNRLIMEYLTRPESFTLQRFFVRYPYARLGMVVVLAVLLSLALIAVNRQRTLRLIRDKNLQLQEATQRAEAGNEAKSRFLSGISHDMRTPLNGIIGFTAFALQEEDAAKKQQDLQKVQQSSAILLDLINNTLEMSRIESGKFTLLPERVMVQELIRNIIVVIQAEADKKQVDFQTDIDAPEDSCILADRLKLQEIFLNLLSNAVKYTPSGGHVRLLVQVHSQSLHIVVDDDGIGISPEFLPHIYDSFAQERAAEMRTVPGTGLGLAIVRKIVDLMQGHIQAESEKGKGTRFTVTLPVEFPVQEDGAAAASEGRLQDVSVLKGRHVLLCEDNELNREIAVVLLEQQGMQVDCAVNGRQGLEIFEQSAAQTYDLILMDIHMPEMDGYVATRAIRALPRKDAEAIPIIAMTADAYAEDVQKCLAGGMDGHVAKPIDSAQLYGVLADALTAAESRQ